ncbi:MAG: DNA polymerase III subunit gamma/tau [Acidobacteria bacterium]|nr:MAG: DNA polymerase III subunit gamma/tau [Acidobacteriota bacterium]
MSYQVIARKWRPQKFDDVVGQQAVTRTLRNALTSDRLAQAFVFAGPRGVGKTTTARILARALNCVQGPTADPCGTCEACVEITEGRDIDVLEIDAATHTGIDNVREVIISGLAIRPARNRYKIFIIDEVHQLSTPSFNALLKSIEEPPPHVVFMMATTELEKIPETVLSRAQVYEFRAIGTKPIAAQLRRIVDAERITIGDESLQLIARDAEGSMRDAQTKLDQVIAFTGTTIASADVATVLGLVGRDLLLDAVEAVAAEDTPSAFRVAEQAVELGYDLRAVCRELSRLVRDLLVVSVDPSRLSDPEIAGESERDRVKALAGRFSREDLLRAFDLLTKAEADMKAAAQPRHHLEMAFLRWMYLRKLVPIEDLIAGAGGLGQSATRTSATSPKAASRPPVRSTAVSVGSRPNDPSAVSVASSEPPVGSGFSRIKEPDERSVASGSGRSNDASVVPGFSRTSDDPSVVSGLSRTSEPSGSTRTKPDPSLKDALLAEIRKSKVVFYNTVIAQAQRIDVAGDCVTFTFSANHRTLRDMFDQNRAWVEAAAQQVAGRRIVVSVVQNGQSTESSALPAAEPGKEQAGPPDRKSALREQALADAGVQAMLDVFSAEIRDVEEM